MINLPQDVVSFANSLPRVLSELNVLVVQKESEQSHRDFCVRRSVVQEALTWLLENNRYYRAVPYVGVIILRNGTERNGTKQFCHIILRNGTGSNMYVTAHMTAKHPYSALKCTSYRQ